MDWSESTSSKNYVRFKFPVCFAYILGKVNFFNQLNVYRKSVEKFHNHRWIPSKIKENTEIQITAQFFLKSPDLWLLIICSYTWKCLNRIRVVSTVCLLFHFQSYFSDPVFVHFTHHYFSKLDENPVFKSNFQFLKTSLKLCKTYPAFGECHNKSTCFTALWNTFILIMMQYWKTSCLSGTENLLSSIYAIAEHWYFVTFPTFLCEGDGNRTNFFSFMKGLFPSWALQEHFQAHKNDLSKRITSSSYTHKTNKQT